MSAFIVLHCDEGNCGREYISDTVLDYTARSRANKREGWAIAYQKPDNPVLSSLQVLDYCPKHKAVAQ